MTHERLGYLVLGIVLAAAVVYGGLALRQTSTTAPPNLEETEMVEGETSSSSQPNLDDILQALPTTEQNTFDPAVVDWINYTDGQDGFVVQRPRGWEVSESALQGQPDVRRIVLSEGFAAFSIYPRGEFDVGLPSREVTQTALTVSGRSAAMHEWHLPDGSWLAVVTHDSQPKNGFRIELSTLQPSATSRAILKEMLNRFFFLEDLQ